jgi:hypothetical protein
LRLLILSTIDALEICDIPDRAVRDASQRLAPCKVAGGLQTLVIEKS